MTNAATTGPATRRTGAYGYQEPSIADAWLAVTAATPLTAMETWTALLAVAGLSGEETTCAALAHLLTVMVEHPDRAVSVSARALRIRLDTYHRLARIHGPAACATTTDGVLR